MADYENNSDNFLALVGSVSYFVGTLFLFSCGDASHMSLRTLHLMAVQFALQIPFFFLPGLRLFADIVRYAAGLAVFAFVFWQFYKEDSKFKFRQTYNRELDSFPFHWLLVLPAIAIPILLILFAPSGLLGTSGVCLKGSFGAAAGICTFATLWTMSYCLMPLMFLPQLYVVHKLSREGTALKFNVKAFLFCMLLYAVALLVINLFFPLILKQMAIITSILSIGVILTEFGWGFVTRCLCRGKGPNAATADAGGTPAATTSAAAGGDLELPNATVTPAAHQHATEDYDLPSVTTASAPAAPAYPPSTGVGSSPSPAPATGDGFDKSWLS